MTYPSRKMTVTVTVEDKSVQKPPVIMQEVLLYYEKQTVPWFSVALVMKNKTPFDMLLYDIIATAGNDKYDIKSFCFRIKKINFF